MQIIPFKDPGSWQMQISLTNVIFIFDFHWNALNKYWLMDILDQDGTPVIYGIKVVTNYDITAQFAAVLGMPVGDIVCQNIVQEWFDIGRFDMGNTTELIYYEPNELASTPLMMVSTA